MAVPPMIAAGTGTGRRRRTITAAAAAAAIDQKNDICLLLQEETRAGTDNRSMRNGAIACAMIKSCQKSLGPQTRNGRFTARTATPMMTQSFRRSFPVASRGMVQRNPYCF